MKTKETTEEGKLRQQLIKGRICTYLKVIRALILSYFSALMKLCQWGICCILQWVVVGDQTGLLKVREFFGAGQWLLWLWKAG